MANINTDFPNNMKLRDFANAVKANENAINSQLEDIAADGLITTDEGWYYYGTNEQGDKGLFPLPGFTPGGEPNDQRVNPAPNSVALRDEAGRSQFASPLASADAANKEYVDQQIASLDFVTANELNTGVNSRGNALGLAGNTLALLSGNTQLSSVALPGGLNAVYNSAHITLNMAGVVSACECVYYKAGNSALLWGRTTETKTTSASSTAPVYINIGIGELQGFTKAIGYSYAFNTTSQLMAVPLAESASGCNADGSKVYFRSAPANPGGVAWVKGGIVGVDYFQIMLYGIPES